MPTSILYVNIVSSLHHSQQSAAIQLVFCQIPSKFYFLVIVAMPPACCRLLNQLDLIIVLDACTPLLTERLSRCQLGNLLLVSTLAFV
jgi:hypothetical protein